ncbi:MAG: hypothetical protein LBE25_15610 [Arthrobacter sp.]|jgi:hypothetical protein|nr:hypothetical protein [Arthrobacter sp.]
MLLRRFAPDDTPALTRLVHRAYAELGEAGLNFTGVDQSEATTLSRATAGATWVLIDASEPVGCVTMSWPPEAALAHMTQEAAVG